MKLGARGQLLTALLAVFAVSFGLLSLATLKLTRRDASLAHAQHAQAYAATLLDAFAEQDDAAFEHALVRLHDAGRVSAFELRAGKRRVLHGSPQELEGLSSHQRGERRLALSLPEVQRPRTAALERLLLFYVSLTGLSVMALAYQLLTWTIVRPLQLATNSAEALARGDLHARMPLSGAAEVVRLSKAFNVMADALRAERVTLEERVRELETLTSQLRESRNQVIHAEKLASVGRLSAGVAHEIGNPLAAILGMLELLQSEGLSEQEQRDFIARVQRETERIHGIISELLAYARRDSVDDLESAKADVRAVAEDVLTLLHGQLNASRSRCSLNLPDGLFARVPAPQLTQVLLNLLLNAADAAGEGGQVVVHGQRDGSDVFVHVDDNGPGIAPQMADHLFEPFATTKSPGQGTGLGLFVTHALVQRMRGEITAGKNANGGARFTVRLPAADSR